MAGVSVRRTVFGGGRGCSAVRPFPKDPVRCRCIADNTVSVSSRGARLGCLIAACRSLAAHRLILAELGENTLALALRAAKPVKSPVLAPPYYLYLAGRLGVDQFADINLWGQEADRGDARAVHDLSVMVNALDRGAVPMVLADNRVRALKKGVPEALKSHYKQLPLHDSLPSDRSVTVWVPR